MTTSGILGHVGRIFSRNGKLFSLICAISAGGSLRAELPAGVVWAHMDASGNSPRIVALTGSGNIGYFCSTYAFYLDIATKRVVSFMRFPDTATQLHVTKDPSTLFAISQIDNVSSRVSLLRTKDRSTVWSKVQGRFGDCSLSPDGQYFAVSDASDIVKVYRVADGSVALSFAAQSATDMAFSYDSQFIAYHSGGRTFILRMSNGTLLKLIQDTVVRDSGFSPNGSYFFLTQSVTNDYAIYRTSDWTKLFNVNASATQGLEFGPNSDKVIKKSSQTAEFAVPSGTLINQGSAPSTLTYSATGNEIYTDGNGIRCLTLSDFSDLWVAPRISSAWRITATNDDSIVSIPMPCSTLTGDAVYPGSGAINPAGTATYVAKPQSVQETLLPGQVPGRTFSEPLTPGYVDVSKDGRFLGTKGSYGVSMWDLASGQLLWRIPSMHNFVFGTDTDNVYVANQTIHKVDCQTGTILKSIPVGLGGAGTVGLAVSPGGFRIAAYASSGTARVFDVASGALLTSISATADNENVGLAFDRKGHHVFCGANKDLKAYSITTGLPVWQFGQGVGATDLLVSKDGHSLYVSGSQMAGKVKAPHFLTLALPHS